jgi:uncharacterized membrane protein (DUF485 family)
VDYLTVGLVVWLGIALLALILAELYLWRTRRVLNRLRPELGVPEGRLVPAAAVTQMAMAVAAP